MSDVRASYGTHLELLLVLGILIHYCLLTTIHDWSVVSSQNFHRLCVLSIHTFWYVDMSVITIS